MKLSIALQETRVSGHDFSRAVPCNKIAGFSRCLCIRKEIATPQRLKPPFIMNRLRHD
jgi:hypothetical protein